MVCLFCASEEHKSRNCDKYVTDESRKEIAKKNGFCWFCFIKSNDLQEEERTKNDESSINNYSTANHTLFCRERVTAFKLFLPKLDGSLLPKFLDMFELDEKYSMALSTPTAPNFLLLKPIKIMDTFNYEQSDKYVDVTLLNNSTIISNFDIEKDKELLLDAITSNTLICVPRLVSIKNSKLSSQLLLQLLSKYTTKLFLYRSSFSPNISFTEIIKNAPNLESISIYDFSTNIKIDNTWLDNLMEYKTGKKLNYLSIKLDAVEEFDVEKMVDFVKTKCTKDITIQLQYDQALLDTDDDGNEAWEKLDQLGQKLLKYFDDYFGIDQDELEHQSFLKIGIDGVDGYQTFSLTKAWETETASKSQT